MSDANTNAASETDWAKVDAMTDAEIDISDIPELDEAWFANAKVISGKTLVGPAPQSHMSADFKAILSEHLSNVASFARAERIADRVVAKQRLDESFSKLVATPHLGEADTRALDDVTRYLSTR